MYQQIITSLFRKLTNVSANNYNIDIMAISDPLKMWKNVISAQILIQIGIIIPCCTRGIKQVLP